MTREGTRLESVEQFRQAAGRDEIRSSTVPDGLGSTETDSVQRFRPLLRPPMALLCAQFDGRDDGQWFPVQASSFSVGRAEADLCISHDFAISSRHFELRRSHEATAYRWHVVDLDSRNGTFARIADALLHHDDELIVGRHRYQFKLEGAEEAADSEQADAAPQRNVTQLWQAPVDKETTKNTGATLVEVLPDGAGSRTALNDLSLIGSDPKRCLIEVTGDPLVQPVHAKIYRDERQRWHLAGEKSLNGTWLKISEVCIEKSAQIQAGEQRFLIRIL